MLKNILMLNLFFPIFAILLLVFIPTKEKRIQKLIAFDFSCFSFIGFVILWLFYDKSSSKFQFVNKFLFIPILNINLSMGVDGISLLFLLLTTLLIPLCILSSWNNISYYLKEFLILFLLLDFFLMITFCSLDLLCFYIFFESVLIPMFLIVGIWGSRERKVLAAFYFFLYTLFGSVIMLLSVIYILDQLGTTDYEVILTFSFSKSEQKLLWFCFFLSFASKIPMIPVHLWLPEAHVEAPTAGSVILAGILLKLGTYGFIRFSLPIFPKASFFYAPLVFSLVVISVIYASLTAIRQSDFKRIIAYSSIGHMNLVVLGIFSFNVIGLEGAIFQSLSHGFIASGLFFLIGILYDRFKTRTIKYFGGLTTIMPLYSCFFLFFSLANIGFPGTSSFVGEFLILTGAFKTNIFTTFLCATSMIISGAYSLWLYNKIAYGNLKLQYINTFYDMNFREVVILLPLAIGSVISGIYSRFFLNVIQLNVNYIVELLYF
jgi:proton-translocating NADH-quinone oxidoreductase chain M